MLRAALIVGVLAMIATWSIAMGAPRGAQAFDARGSAVVADDTRGAPQIDRAAQANESDNDNSLHVVLWTVLAAGIAAGVGLVLYMVRVILGRVQPPPGQHEDAHH